MGAFSEGGFSVTVLAEVTKGHSYCLFSLFPLPLKCSFTYL